MKTHLNTDKIESNLSVPGIQERHENALIKSFEMSLHLICLLVNELEDRTKGSENPGSRSFLRILIWIWTALRIGLKDLDPFLPNQIQIQILNNVHTTNVL